MTVADILKLWSQLSLTPDLHIMEEGSGLILFLGHGKVVANPVALPRGWYLESNDARPPDVICSGEFEALQLKLNLYTPQKRERPFKKAKSSSKNYGTERVMILNSQKPRSTLQSLEAVVDTLSQKLSKSITACFELPESHPGLVIQSLQAREEDGAKIEQSVRTIAVGAKQHSRNQGPAKNMVHQEADSDDVLLLEAQKPGHLDKNVTHEDEEMLLLTSYENEGYSTSNNMKQDMLAPYEASLINLQDSDESMLLSMSSLEEVLPGSMENEDDDMLLFELNESPSSLESQSSSNSFENGAPPSVSRKRNHNARGSTIPYKLEYDAVCTLVLAALRTVIGGTGQKKLSNVNLGRQSHGNTMSNLVPSIFSPGYKELMCHNAKFLPTISNAIALSCVRNVQSPGLRSKLIDLSQKTVSDLTDDKIEGIDVVEGTVERLSAVIQGRVWAMMQRKLLDSKAAEKLRWSRSGELVDGNDGEEEEVDLLQRAGTVEEQGLNLPLLEEDFGDSGLFEEWSMDEEEELLIGDIWNGNDYSSSDHEGLLDYFEEEERRLVEMETDEMLFGEAEESGSNEVTLRDSELDDMLLEEYIENIDVMLL